MKKIIFSLLFIFSASAFGQTFSVFNIDTTNFPNLKAQFIALDAAGKQLANLNSSDFEVKENGTARTGIIASCPAPKEERLSIVFAVDVTVYNDINNAKNVLNAWLDFIPLNVNEIAIMSYDGDSYINQDFTTNKAKLQNTINSLATLSSSEDHTGALVRPTTGAIAVAKTGKYKPMVIVLSSCSHFIQTREKSIIEEAQKFNVTINFNIFDKYDWTPSVCQNIARETGGFSNNHIPYKDLNKAISSIQLIIAANRSKPCSIEWLSRFVCQAGKTNVSIKLLPLNTIQNEQYTSPLSQISKLEFWTRSLIIYNSTPGFKRDTVVTLTARNSDIKVTNIKSSHPAFSFDKTSFLIPKNQSVDLKISYLPKDSSYVYSRISIETDVCPFEMTAVAYFKSKKSDVKTIKLTKPNGGEEFLVGSDNIISWEGIPETDTVSLDYSIDSGKNWKKFKGKTPGLTYNWENTPPPTSDRCLVRVSQIQSGQTPQIDWQKCLGGTSTDKAYSVLQTKDGGFIVAGSTNSSDGDVKENHGGSDIWVAKLSAFGDIDWQKCLGGTSNDVATSIAQTSDGGFIVAGYTYSNDGDVIKNHGGADAWVVKLNFTGDFLWQKCLGGTNYDEANSIAQTSDGGFIVAGSTYSSDGDFDAIHGLDDAWVIKLNFTGVIEWKKYFGGSSFDRFTSILQSFDGGFIIVGKTESNDGDVKGHHGGADVWVVKLNTVGIVEWQKCLGGTWTDEAYSVLQTKDGGFIVAGSTNSNDGDVSGNHGKFDVWVVKLNTVGIVEWLKCVGEPFNDYVRSIQQTSDGGYIVAGFAESIDGDFKQTIGSRDAWVVKLSADGNSMQQDQSDAVFSIVEPKATAISVEMGKCLVSMSKDSVVTQFAQNIGSYKCRIDSIYIQGADASAFKLIGGFPKYEIEKAGAHFAEFNFKPSRIGVHNAEIVVVTQSDTIKVPITGEGMAQQLQIMSGVLDFGMVEVGNEKVFTDTVVVKNVSTAPISISKIVKMSPDLEQFDIISGGDPFVLNAGETHKMTLRFKPKFGGRTSGRIGFDYNGTGSPITATLFGTGIGGVVVSSSDSAYSGEKKNINISLKNIKPAGLQAMAKSFSANLKFQGRILAPQDFSQVLSFKNDSITMRVSGDLPNDSTILSIPMIAGLGNVEETSIEISDFKLYDNSGTVIDYDMEVEYGTFKVLGICREGGTRLVNPNSQAQILSVRPNPATNAINIEYQLTEKGGAEFLLINDLGETVKQISYGEISDYSQRLETINLDDLASGRYTLILKTPTISERRSVLVVK